MIVIFSILVISLISEGVSDDVFDPSTCGEINLKETSGWITSPRYPNKYVQNTFCEWIINAKPDHVVEIKFHDFELGNKNNLDDYVLIYEEVNGEDGGSPTKYFDGSLTLNPNMSVTYRSKSNFVIVQFSSGSRMNFKGFNASYRSYDTYCDKDSLAADGAIDLDFTFCNRGTNRKNFYKQCYVWCNSKYMLSSNSTKVVCQDGSFQPQNVCDLIPYKVTECENTNLKNCPYVPKELADYWRRKEPLGPDDAEGVDFDLFPDIQKKATGSRSIRGQFIETSCIDKLIGYSYCKRKPNKKFAFKCNVFTKIPKLKPAIGDKKMEACYKCRAIQCTATIYL